LIEFCFAKFLYKIRYANQSKIKNLSIKNQKSLNQKSIIFMKKIIILTLLLLGFISNEKGFAQPIDIGNYYIISQSPLSAERKAQIESITKDFNIALQTNLVVKGYTTLNDSNLRQYNTELYGHHINFNAVAGRVIFNRILFDDTERLSIISYLCDVTYQSGVPILDPIRAHTSSGPINLWYDTDEKNESLHATTEGLLNTPSIDTFMMDEDFRGTPEDDTLNLSKTPRLTATNIAQ